jgi:hypothetical protein
MGDSRERSSYVVPANGSGFAGPMTDSGGDDDSPLISALSVPSNAS